MTVIGIDPGTRCGWAVLDDGGQRLASGTWDLSVRRGESEGMRYVRFRRELGTLLDAYAGAVVVYEEVRRHAGTTAAHVYGALTGVLMALCVERNVNFAKVPVGTVKKHATGRGNAGKDAMVEAAYRRWIAPSRWEGSSDDNEADALWIASAFLEGLT